jgi:phage baseplate assembly protein W
MTTTSTPLYSDLDAALGVDPTGNLTTNTDTDTINQSVMNILSTVQGERLFLPTFGSNIYDLLFEPMGNETATSLRYEITTALADWENRIIVDSVSVVPNFNLSQYKITVNYTITLTQQTGVFEGIVQGFSG